MKKYFLTGLAILLPLAITVAVVAFLINFLTEPFVGAVSEMLKKQNIINDGFLFLSPEQLLIYGSKLLILFLLFFGIVLLGIVTRWLLIRTFFKIGDRIIHKIPIVKTVYKTTKEIVDTLFTSDKNAFKQVVMVPFPKKDVFVLGFLVREAPPICSEAAKSSLITVLIPTTPNPTTGFLLLFKEEDLVYLNIKPEDAIKYIVSCGMIHPPETSQELKRSK